MMHDERREQFGGGTGYTEGGSVTESWAGASGKPRRSLRRVQLVYAATAIIEVNPQLPSQLEAPSIARRFIHQTCKPSL